MRRLFARFHLLTEDRAVGITQPWVIRGADGGGRLGVSHSPLAGIGEGTNAT